jgi:hypothetical protein
MFLKMPQRLLATALLVLVAATSAASANDHEATVRSHLDAINSWANNPVIIEAIRAQNDANAALSQAEIDRADTQWRGETKASNRPMIESVLAKPISAFLGDIKAESEGLYTEIFVMDNRGLNVGQSDVTSDYWQGDEDKWQKTFQVGPGAVFIDEIEHDESTQTFQSQVSLAISDPVTNQIIGAITIGLDVEVLLN